jgi:plasmid replication initiation protein
MEERNNLVVKSNDLIRKTRYSLSEREQKIIIYIISNIEPDQQDLKTLTLSLKEFCKVCSIEISGKNYGDIKAIIKDIRDKSWWLEDQQEEILFSWLDTVNIRKSQGEIDIKLSESLKPYLLQLRANFTKYELINVLTLRGKYSIRLYELLKSYLWKGSWQAEVDSLKNIINANGYKDFKEFNRTIIKKSIKEINDYTDLNITYKTIKQGRKIKYIDFQIQEKQGYQLSIDMLLRRAERLD